MVLIIDQPLSKCSQGPNPTLPKSKWSTNKRAALNDDSNDGHDDGEDTLGKLMEHAIQIFCSNCCSAAATIGYTSHHDHHDDGRHINMLCQPEEGGSGASPEKSILIKIGILATSYIGQPSSGSDEGPLGGS